MPIIYCSYAEAHGTVLHLQWHGLNQTTSTKSIQHPPGDEHGLVNGCNNNDLTNNIQNSREDDGLFPTKTVRDEESREQGASELSGDETRCHGSLSKRGRLREIIEKLRHG